MFTNDIQLCNWRISPLSCNKGQPTCSLSRELFDSMAECRFKIFLLIISPFDARDRKYYLNKLVYFRKTIGRASLAQVCTTLGRYQWARRQRNKSREENGANDLLAAGSSQQRKRPELWKWALYRVYFVWKTDSTSIFKRMQSFSTSLIIIIVPQMNNRMLWYRIEIKWINGSLFL